MAQETLTQLHKDILNLYPRLAALASDCEAHGLADERDDLTEALNAVSRCQHRLLTLLRRSKPGKSIPNAKAGRF